LHAAVQATPGGVEIAIERLEGTYPALVRHMLVKLWERQGWPLQDMSFGKWEELLAFASAPFLSRPLPPPQMFPGGIRAERTSGKSCG
jgi:hypothetical protein